MKILLFCLLLPVLSLGQTIHIKEDKIVYEGKEKMASPALDIFNRAENALPKIVDNFHQDKISDHSIQGRGELKLTTPHHLIRTVTYSIKINTIDSGYEYLIDSVSFREQERGGKAVTKPSEEVLKDMEETGKIVGDTEKILNETDMRIQKLLAILKKEINQG
jgi:hypothetical protein